MIGPPDSNGLRWQFVDASAARPDGRLVFGIPETDAVQVVATCRASEPRIIVDVSLPTGARARGARLDVRFGGSLAATKRPGMVIIPRASEGMSGVRLRLDPQDEIWSALMTGKVMTYSIGGAARPLTLTGSAQVIGAFLAHCRALAGDGAGRHAGAAAACRDPRKFRSVDGGPRVSTVLVNRSGEFRHVERIERSGKLIPMGTLETDGMLTLDTREGDSLMLTDGPGNCIEILQPRAGERRIEIRIKSPGFGDE